MNCQDWYDQVWCPICGQECDIDMLKKQGNCDTCHEILGAGPVMIKEISKGKLEEPEVSD